MRVDTVEAGYSERDEERGCERDLRRPLPRRPRRRRAAEAAPRRAADARRRWRRSAAGSACRPGARASRSAASPSAPSGSASPSAASSSAAGARRSTRVPAGSVRTRVRSVEWPSMAADELVVHGAREHNLKDITVRLPRNALICITGLSGLREVEPCLRHDLRRGPAALRRVALGLRAPVPADDGEARRRLDRRASARRSRSTRRRRRATRARPSAPSPRSTTTCGSSMRGSGRPHCPICGRPIAGQSIDSIVEQILALPEGRASRSTRRSSATARASTATCSRSCATRASRASRSTASSTCSRSRRRSTRSSSTRSRSSSTGS